MRHALKPALVFILTLLTCLYQGAATAAETAKDYPTKPIRFVLAQTAGSSIDTMSRVVATKLG